MGTVSIIMQQTIIISNSKVIYNYNYFSKTIDNRLLYS